MYLLLWCFIIIKNCGKLSKMGIYKNNFFFFWSQKVVQKRSKAHYSHKHEYAPNYTHKCNYSDITLVQTHLYIHSILTASWSSTKI